MKKFLYAYFGKIYPFDTDIPGHFLYQPFLINEIASILSPDNKYKIDLYSYLSDIPKHAHEVKFDHYLSSIKDLVLEWISNHIDLAKHTVGYIEKIMDSRYLNTRTGECEYYTYENNILNVLNKIKTGQYDNLILKARFRNISTLSKKLYDVEKFETIIQEACKYDVPVTIVDTDLSFSESAINDLIIKNNNVKVIGLGNLNLAYNRLIPENKIINTRLFGISLEMLKKVQHSFKNNLKDIIHGERCKRFIFYGNIAYKNYKAGHTKNSNILSYLLKIKEEKEFNFLSGVFIGKIEDQKFRDLYTHLPRYERQEIAKIHKNSSVSINITKDIYNKTDFTPARITESWIYGLLPVSYSTKKSYLGNPSLTFTNYREFREIMRYYMLESNLTDYGKNFLTCLDNYIKFRENFKDG